MYKTHAYKTVYGFNAHDTSFVQNTNLESSCLCTIASKITNNFFVAMTNYIEYNVMIIYSFSFTIIKSSIFLTHFRNSHF